VSHVSHVKIKHITSQMLVTCHHIIIILLRLIRSVCLCMSPSVPVHIHPHMSKKRLVIENWWEINEPCLYWISCIPGTTAKEHLVMSWNRPLSHKGLICMPWKDGIWSTPSKHLVALRWNRSFSCLIFDHYKHVYLLIPSVSPSRCKLSIYYGLYSWWSVYRD